MDRGLIFLRPLVRLNRGDAATAMIGVLDVPVPKGRRPVPEVIARCGHEKPVGDNPAARTVIRHRCARRVSKGVRENPREGTRQILPVPSV